MGCSSSNATGGGMFDFGGSTAVIDPYAEDAPPDVVRDEVDRLYINLKDIKESILPCLEEKYGLTVIINEEKEKMVSYFNIIIAICYNLLNNIFNL